MSDQLCFFIFSNVQAVLTRCKTNSALSTQRARALKALSCLLLITLTQIVSSAVVFAQTKPAQVQTAPLPPGDSQIPSGAGQTTQNTVPNPYDDAIGTLNATNLAAPINQNNINTGVNQIISGQPAPLVFQAAEQGQGGEMQKAAVNALNFSLGSVNDTYRGMHQWFKDDLVTNLFSNIGQLVVRVHKWLDLRCGAVSLQILTRICT